jgi:hypothetical protein
MEDGHREEKLYEINKVSLVTNMISKFTLLVPHDIRLHKR